MSDPLTQIPSAADDPWAQFPDADPESLYGLSTPSLPPQPTQRTLGFDLRLPSNPAWLGNTAPVAPNYAAAPNTSASRYGMFGRGPDDPDRDVPAFQILPNFGPANLDLGNLAVRQSTPPWAFTDPKGKNVAVVGSDGWATVRNNASGAAWRDNNPGNMKPDGFTSKWGQVGANTECESCKAAGPFAIMPDAQSGWNAMIDKLSHSPRYAGPNLDQVIANWVVGPNRKHGAALPKKYIDDIHSFTGWPKGIQYNQTNPQMVDTLARAIKRRDGWLPGEVSYCNMNWPAFYPKSP